MTAQATGGANALAALQRNIDLLTGRLGFIGLPAASFPAGLDTSTGPVLVITEHAGVRDALAASPRCEVAFGYQPPESALLPLDALVLFVPKAREALTMQLALACSLLKPGGRLVLVGEKREGVAGASRRLLQLDPDAYKVDSARHCQVWSARPSSAGSPFDQRAWLSWYQVEAAGTPIAVAGMPGIFSNGRLDLGTESLLATLADVPVQGPVLDFACGAGVIGAWLQTRYGDLGPVDAVDVQFQAVSCARQTYDRNGVSGQVLASDGLPESLGRYQTIVTNPPFHSGVRTDTSMTERFLAQARSHLRPGGELRLVANRFLAYQPLLEGHIGPCRVLAEDGKFIVYQARVPS